MAWIDPSLWALLADDATAARISGRRRQGIQEPRDLKSQLDNSPPGAELGTAHPLLQATLEAADVALWHWDVNSDRMRFFGKPEELHGIAAEQGPKTFSDFLDRVHPDDRPRLTRIIEATLETGRPLRARFRLCDPDGKHRWLDARAELRRGEHEQPRQVLGMTRDITWRIETDRRIESQQRKLLQLSRDDGEQPDATAAARRITRAAAAILDTEAASLWLFDAQRTCLHCIDRFEPHGDGHSAGQRLELRPIRAYVEALLDARTLPIADLTADPRTQQLGSFWPSPPGLRAMLGAVVRQSGEAIGLLCCEHVGSKRHWHPDEQGFAGSLADRVAISLERLDRRRTESTLYESERRFRSLVQNLPAVAYRCAADPTWTSEFVSEGIEDLCGYPASDFVDNATRSLMSIVHPDDTPRATAEIQAAITADRSYSIEYRMRQRDGGLRWVKDRGRAVKDRGGETLWLDGVITDITETKHAEQRIANQSGLLLELATHEALARGDLERMLELIT
ncbi:MAG: PAS domain-containing protein, partial [Chromatiales bacterium]